MVYISCKHGPNLAIVSRNNFCSLGNAISFSSVKPQFIPFRTQDINFVFSNIRHKIKHSLFGEEIKFIFSRW